MSDRRRHTAEENHALTALLLDFLKEHGPCHCQPIKEAASKSSGYVTYGLKLLETQGLVSQSPPQLIGIGRWVRLWTALDPPLPPKPKPPKPSGKAKDQLWCTEAGDAWLAYWRLPRHIRRQTPPPPLPEQPQP